MVAENTRILGRTGLKAGRLGVAAGYGAPARSFEEAFDRGCNYFYWGSMRKDNMRQAIVNICTLFPKLADQGIYDIFHIRYNAAHRGAEDEVFPHLPEEDRPGIVTYTATRWGQLLKPKKMPPGESPPKACDCYRFVITNPNVDVCMCGPKNDHEMKEALPILDLGPLDHEALQRMQRIGAHVHGKKRK